MRRYAMGALALVLVTMVVANAQNAIPPGSSFVRIHLPVGISLNVPRGWHFLGPDEKRLVETYAESMWDLTNLPIPRGRSGVLLGATAPAGSGYMSIALVVEFRSAATQQEVQQISRGQLMVLDKQNRQDIEAGSSFNGLKILSWEGTTIERVGEYWAVVKRYEYSLPGMAPRRMENVQFLLGNRIVSLLLQSGEMTLVPARPIFERVKSGVTFK